MQYDPRFVVLHALAAYHDVRPDGLPERAMIGLIDAEEYIRLTKQELDDAIGFLVDKGLVERNGPNVQLTESMAQAIPRDGERVSDDKREWPALGDEDEAS